MVEADIQPQIGEYLKKRQNDFKSPFVCEVKLAKKISIPFSAVQPHQIEGLLQAEKGQYIKLYDTLGREFTHKKPYDFIWNNNVRAFVCIVFYKPYKKKSAYFIDIHKWISVQRTHPRKSIREDEIAPICSFAFSLLKNKRLAFHSLPNIFL